MYKIASLVVAGLLTIVGLLAAYAQSPRPAIVIGGFYSTELPTLTNGQSAALQQDVNGVLLVQLKNSAQVDTYNGAVVNLNAAASATDIACISGSATKLITVTNATFSGTTTLGTSATYTILKRSTANTGGTSTTPAPASHDSTNPAPTAVVRAYTANPTTGSLVGNLRSMTVPLLALGGAQSATQLTFNTLFGQGIILRGTAESLCFNQGGTTVAGNNINIDFQWSES